LNKPTTYECVNTNQKSIASIEGNRYERAPIGTRVDLSIKTTYRNPALIIAHMFYFYRGGYAKLAKL
jgi:hypothetical protein